MMWFKDIFFFFYNFILNSQLENTLDKAENQENPKPPWFSCCKSSEGKISLKNYIP